MSKIKKPSVNQGSKVKVDESRLNREDINFPCFSFKYLHNEYSLDNCDKEEKCALISQLASLSQFTWSEIRLKGRHAMGSEKIAINALKSNIPNSFVLTEDVDFLLALRFHGEKPFVGHLRMGVFYIFFIDTKFRLYKHS